MLEIKNFGSKKIHENIYNKFFRTAINYGVKAFFGDYGEVVIKKVYHDNGNMENHKYFPYLNLKKLDDLTSDSLIIRDANVSFIDSDHKSYLQNKQKLLEDSHLIQYIDLIIGIVTQNFFYLSDDAIKKEIAMILRPLIKRLSKNPYDKNSSYNYYKKQKISFFPRHKIKNAKQTLVNLNGDLVETFKKGQFYSNRKLKMPYYDPKQLPLSKFISM